MNNSRVIWLDIRLVIGHLMIAGALAILCPSWMVAVWLLFCGAFWIVAHLGASS